VQLAFVGQYAMLYWFRWAFEFDGTAAA
jgi:hypothetical protein